MKNIIKTISYYVVAIIAIFFMSTGISVMGIQDVNSVIVMSGIITLITGIILLLLSFMKIYISWVKRHSKKNDKLANLEEVPVEEV